jgi:hypothetical protein
MQQYHTGTVMKITHTMAMLDMIERIRDTRIDRGLSLSELDGVESFFAFRFPPDLAELLRAGLPIGEKWPNWRAAVQGDDNAIKQIQQMLDWPHEGMCFDVEHNGAWDPSWGSRPASMQDALRIASDAVRAAPMLIPVYGHRYLPSDPCEAGNPVFSIHQWDIIVYGRDLQSYFEAECDGWRPELSADAKTIRSWTAWSMMD